MTGQREDLGEWTRLDGLVFGILASVAREKWGPGQVIQFPAPEVARSTSQNRAGEEIAKAAGAQCPASAPPNVFPESAFLSVRGEKRGAAESAEHSAPPKRVSQ